MRRAIGLSLVLLLAGCGGGGGDGGNPSTPLDDGSSAPADDAFGETDTPTEPVEPDPEPESEPNSAPEPEPTPDPGPEPSPTPADMFGPLADLFGQVTIVWTFVGTESNVFSITAVFGPEDVTDTGVIIVPFASTTVQLGSEPAVRGRDFALGCTLLEDERQFLCTARPLSSDARTQFLFDRPVNGESVGTFVFCDAAVSDRACAENLLLSPDGVMAVQVDDPPATAHIARHDTGLDLVPYLKYAEQGVPIPDGIRSDTDRLDMVLDVLDALSAAHGF